MELTKTLLWICPILFFAGVVDGAVGGGGLIALPAYLMTGMPVHCAYGCNKLQSLLGTSISLITYIRNGLFDKRIAYLSAPVALIGSQIATRLILQMDGHFIPLMVLIFTPIILVLMFVKSNLSSKTCIKAELSTRSIILTIILGILLGFYDGLYGPGGGTIAMILFTLFFNYDMRVSCGNGKFIIVVSNLIAFLNYFVRGDVLYEIAIPAALANMLGCHIGAGLAVKKGTRFIMPLMLCVITFLLVHTALKIL